MGYNAQGRVYVYTHTMHTHIYMSIGQSYFILISFKSPNGVLENISS